MMKSSDMTNRGDYPTTPPSRRRRWIVRMTGSLAVIVMCLGVGANQSESSTPIAQTGPVIEQMRETLDKWVETRRVISQERRDWAIGRELLNERIDLVGREIESVRTKISDAQNSITEADRKRAELVNENERVKEAVGSLAEMILRLEGRTSSLIARLPEPLQDRIKPLAQRLPDDPDSTKLSMSERYLNVVGILNEINKFNRDITMTSEVRQLPDGASTEVTAMYIGIGHAYYVNAQGTLAGVGRGAADGWTWTPANHAARDIAAAIAILKNEDVAAFIRLPIDID